MTNKRGFDTDLYLKKQAEKLSERLGKFERLYLEFGGKLFSDQHAARVLPGYRPGAKIELLKKLGDIDLFYCVSSIDVAKGKIRGDSGLTYDFQTVKDISDITEYGLKISGVVITLFTGQTAVIQLKNKLENLGYKVYFQNVIEGYPQDLEKVIEGYKTQPYVPAEKRLVVVTGAGGGSGKMAFCLSQVYQEINKGVKAGYAKFETFPIWNLPIDHPVNTAYEASTADLGDINMIDKYHKEAYGIESVNYNRDIENFAILEKILSKITGERNPYGYKSPTDMGVNMAGFGIVDDEVCREAAKQEIIRRYFRYTCERIEGKESAETVKRIEKIMNKSGLKPEGRAVVIPARKSAEDAEKKGKGFKGVYCGSAVELSDGQIVTGKNSPIFHSESAAVLNALKVIAGIPDEIDLISPDMLKEISKMKEDMVDSNSPSLTVNETLIVLAACSAINPTAKKALSEAKNLRGCEFHTTALPSPGDLLGLRILNINVTSDPKRASIKI